MDSLYLAWRYLSYNKMKTFILVGCITIIAALPLALEIRLELADWGEMRRLYALPPL